MITYENTKTVYDLVENAGKEYSDKVFLRYEGPCIQKDDVESIRPKILDADMMVFVTPL